MTHVLPDFLIIGALKSGTTSLFEYLVQHPQVHGSPVKEPRYFLARVAEPWEAARWEPWAPPPVTEAADYARLLDGGSEVTARGEASASYLYDQRVATLLRREVPDARLIAILRDPVGRAWSSYLHVRREGGEEHADVRDALAAEPARIAEGWPAIYHYVQAGRYAHHLSAFLERFPPTQVLLLFQQDLQHDPGSVLARAFRFLDVDPTFRPDMNAVYNRGGVARSTRLHRLLNSPPPGVRSMARGLVPAAVRRSLYLRLHRANLEPSSPPPDVVADLRRTFEDDVAELEDLTGRDLTEWRAGADHTSRGHRP